MGAASGGRLTFYLVALAILMASGVAGVAVVGPGRGPVASGSGPDVPNSGSALSQSRAGPGTAPPAAPASVPPASGVGRGHGTRDAAGRYNIGAAHSPELLRQLGGVPAQTGPAAQASPAQVSPVQVSPAQVSPAQVSPGQAAGASPRESNPGKAGPGVADPSVAGSDATTPAGADPAGGPSATARAVPAEGVDVAAAQHPGGASIDWTQVATAGYRFAAVKATEGDYYPNPYGAADLAGAKAAGLYVTGYHFAIPNVSGGATQADYAVGHGAYSAVGRTLPLELDVEYDPYIGTDHSNECYGLTPTQMVSWIGAFGAEAQRLTGRHPIIYTTAAWWATCTGHSTAFGDDPLWVAAPGPAGPAAPGAPAGWTGWMFWHFTSGATVPGICSAGNTDVGYADVSRVTLPNPGQ